MNKTGKMAFAVLLMTGVQFVSSAAGHLEDQRSAAEGVVVNDLFAATENWPSADFADYCHFTKEANRRLGKLVADFLRKQL